jgi:hypothetical protein
MAEQETPDFVIGAGAPAPLAAPPKAGGVPPASPAVWGAAIGLLLGPPVLAFLVRWLTSQDHWAPLTGLWLATIGLVLGAGWVMEGVDRLEKSIRQGAARRPGQAEAVAFRQALGFGLLVLAVAAATASFEPWMGAVLLGLALAWVGFCAITPERRIEKGFVLEASCSPEVAFEFIADPTNLSRFEPREVVLPPFPESNGVGTVRHVRATTSEGTVIEADEVVTEFVPGRRLAIEVVGVRRRNVSAFDFEPVAGRTRITYTFRGSRAISQLVLGEGFDRAEARRRLEIMQRERAERLKHLLDVQP